LFEAGTSAPISRVRVPLAVVTVTLPRGESRPASAGLTSFRVRSFSSPVRLESKRSTALLSARSATGAVRRHSGFAEVSFAPAFALVVSPFPSGAALASAVFAPVFSSWSF
jgi:hypothetical protein